MRRAVPEPNGFLGLSQIRSAGHNSTQKQGNANFHVPHPLHAFEFDGNMYLLYNGNQFGRFGFGLAVSTL
jgi:hypothetical protein